jgi:hypothetical protein
MRYSSRILPTVSSLAFATSRASAFAFLPVPSRIPGFRLPIAMSMSSMAEKVLATPKWPPEWPYSAKDFARMDESDDGLFYDSPRLVSSCGLSFWNASFLCFYFYWRATSILTKILKPHLMTFPVLGLGISH